MNIVDIIVILVLVFSCIGGFFQGAVRGFFSLLTLLIAIPLTGICYHLMAGLFAFLPGTNWDNFVGFFVTITLISIILQLMFFLLRTLTRRALMNRRLLSRLVGSALNLLNSATGMVVFALVVQAYPVTVWLERAVTDSGILTWLVVHLGFVNLMLPQLSHEAIATVMSRLLLQ